MTVSKVNHSLKSHIRSKQKFLLISNFALLTAHLYLVNASGIVTLECQRLGHVIGQVMGHVLRTRRNLQIPTAIDYGVRHQNCLASGLKMQGNGAETCRSVQNPPEGDGILWNGSEHSCTEASRS